MSVLGFELEWLDNISGQLQTLYLKYFLTDGTIEILQSQIGKAFLKRIFYPDLKLGDLFLGNSISIYNRVMTIKSYANAATKQYFSDKELHILCILNGINDLCTIVSVGNKHGFVVGRVLTVANEVRIADSFVPKGSILFELLGSHGVKQYDALVKDLKILAPAVAVTIQKEAVDDFFGQSKSLSVSSNCSLCLVKPHILRDKKAWSIIKQISDSGFTIRGAHSIHLTNSMADELFGVYRSLYPSYSSMIDELCSGLSLALMIESMSDYDVVETFREFCGPYQPELAAAVRPKSLRAIFGESISKNGVHCTDLSEDGLMECKFIFETLPNL